MTGQASERQRIRGLIERAGVGMLTNVDEHGSQMGRPMLPLFLENDPHIYFLTHQNSSKVTQLAARPKVGVTFISEDCYVLVVGSTSASRDPELVRRLWRPTYRAWFPAGANNREATALRIAVERVDYWEPPRSRFIRLAQALRALITRKTADTPKRSLNGL